MNFSIGTPAMVEAERALARLLFLYCIAWLAHVHRGRITKQGSRLVRWAVVESVQILPGTTLVGQFRDRVAASRGHNIGVGAAGRRQLEYVFYALRDHPVHALNLSQPTKPVASTAA